MAAARQASSVVPAVHLVACVARFRPIGDRGLPIMAPENLLSGLVAIALLGATCGQTLANSVCYQLDEAEGFLRLDVKRHGALTTGSERQRFGSPLQTAYSAQGTLIDLDQVDAPPIVSPVRGTVTVAQGTGSITGLTIPELFSSISVVFSNCWSDEPSATPATWHCRSLGFFTEEVFGPEPFTLTRVDALDEPLCSAFTLPEEEEAPAEQ